MYHLIEMLMKLENKNDILQLINNSENVEVVTKAIAKYVYDNFGIYKKI